MQDNMFRLKSTASTSVNTNNTITLLTPFGVHLSVLFTSSKNIQIKTARQRWVLVVTEPFNIAVNDFDAKKSAR